MTYMRKEVEQMDVFRTKGNTIPVERSSGETILRKEPEGPFVHDTRVTRT